MKAKQIMTQPIKPEQKSKKNVFLRTSVILLFGMIGTFLGTPVMAKAVITASDNMVSANVLHTEHVVWNKVPISFVVPVGDERMISFPGSIAVHNTDSSLTTDKVSIMNNAGTLYIRAKKSFNATRLAIELKATGQIILVDLSAAPNADDSPVGVVMPSASTRAGARSSKNKAKPASAPMSYARLMRYAVQQLFSPERLIKNDRAIHRTPMFTTKSVNLVHGHAVFTMPLISWRGGDLYITAVLLKNTQQHRISLSPKNIKGKWLAASFYPTPYVTAKKQLHDRTTLFLISDRPFNEALNSMREYR